MCVADFESASQPQKHSQMLCSMGMYLLLPLEQMKMSCLVIFPELMPSFRFFAYKQFVLIHHGRLGAGNRVVVPSCVVLRMRLSYPNPDRIYRGFVDGIQDY